MIQAVCKKESILLRGVFGILVTTLSVANPFPLADVHQSAASDRAAIVSLEQEEVAEDMSGSISFYKNNLTEDYSAGTSWGSWYTKQSLLSDLRNQGKNHTNKSTISALKVRLYGDAAVATYDQSYDAVIRGERHIRHVINTGT
jgi:hypothetical protein